MGTGEGRKLGNDDGIADGVGGGVLGVVADSSSRLCKAFCAAVILCNIPCLTNPGS